LQQDFERKTDNLCYVGDRGGGCEEVVACWWGMWCGICFDVLYNKNGGVVQ